MTDPDTVWDTLTSPLERSRLSGSDVREIESALDDLGWDATIVEQSDPSMLTTSDRPAVELTIHMEEQS